MAQRLLFTSVAMAAALLQTEFESWSKGYRAVWLSFGALFGQALLGPSLPAMLLPLVGLVACRVLGQPFRTGALCIWWPCRASSPDVR